MSTGSKIVITVIIIVLIALGVWYAMFRNTATPAALNNSQVNGQTAGTAATIAPTPTPNTSIDDDISSIDAEMKAMDSDSKSIDASLNDKQIQ